MFRQQGFKGLTLLSSYTWSHTTDVSTDSNGGSNVMNPYNWRLDYGSANWDVRHRFVTRLTYELPYLANASQKVVKNILGGWQLNGISTLQSGFPFSVTISADRANVGQGTQRANIISAATVNCGGDPRVSCIPISSFGLPDCYCVWQLRSQFLQRAWNGELRSLFFKNIFLTEQSEAAVSAPSSLTRSTTHRSQIRTARSCPGKQFLAHHEHLKQQSTDSVWSEDSVLRP